MTTLPSLIAGRGRRRKAAVQFTGRRSALALALALAIPASAQVGQPIGSQLEHPTERERQRTGEGISYDVELGAQYSDNRGRAPSGGEDDLILTPRLNVDMFREGARFQASANGQLEFLGSLGGTYDDELRARLAAQLDWAIWPERLYWTVQDYAGIEPIDSFESGAPDNLQQTNVFITGPHLRISPKGVWGGEFDARYVRSYAEETKSFNSERVSAAASLVHRFDPARSIALGVEGTDVDYDEMLGIVGGDPREPLPDDLPPGDPDHDRRDAWLRYRSAFPRLAVDLTGGHSRIEFADGGELSGLLARAFLTWTPNEVHRVGLRVVREYSDAVRDLVSQIDALDPTLDMEGRPEIGPAIYLQRAAELNYQYSWPRARLEITPYSRDYDYQRDADFLDQHSTGVRADVSYLVDSRTTVRGAIGLERRDFDRVDRQDDNLYAGVMFERRFSRQWGMRAGLTRYQRDSSSPTSDYSENVVSVAFVYFGGK